ncbi:hypothetical protein M8C21_008904 [Ambrosia artemisiifolia]|uniref:Malectin-like domain-containing protein n=1 Tax=Ambrosia artemisiifolia TaxID=4212 RepID=A0AAD5GBX1_AMBAR|nr:hypothetical protein M8C21_008904 [Ambrosia artemisiifolia]
MDTNLIFSLIIILLLSPLFITYSYSQTQYTLPDHHFINCGSPSSSNFTGKSFIGDVNPTTFSVSGGQAANNWASSLPTIYQTARVFTRKAWYEFQADANNTESFPAFINAIEAFTTPSDLFRQGVNVPRVSPVGDNGDLDNLSSLYAFIPTYRVNVGGQKIEVQNDTLRRNWVPDDEYIFRSEQARKLSFKGTLTYDVQGASRFDAPDDVYKTTKELTNSLANITWRFEVRKSAMYLVRAHFCDFIGSGLADTTASFNLFVYSQHKEVIQPGNKMNTLQAPFYVDFVVNSLDSLSLNVSIGAINGNNQSAFLNGLEIMELVTNSGVDDHGGNGKKSKTVYIVVGGVALVLVLVLVLLSEEAGSRGKTGI